jgi:hypothetical protein
MPKAGIIKDRLGFIGFYESEGIECANGIGTIVDFVMHGKPSLASDPSLFLPKMEHAGGFHRQHVRLTVSKKGEGPLPEQ